MGKINPEMFLADLKQPEKTPNRDGYGKGLKKLGETNPNVVALCCDLTESTRVEWFKQKFPERFIEVGVAEQNMMSVAAGLAAEGKIPFVSSYAVFSPGRNWDQLRVSVCYSEANVKIQGAHAGISVGPDGATHQALEDLAITRCIPNLTVVVPCDAIEGEKATIESAEIKGPVYLRFGREKIPTITTEKTPFKTGKAEIFRTGKDVTIIACGIMVFEALKAAEELEKENIDAMVINNHTLKPIDEKTLIKAAKQTNAVVTAEEHQVIGGLGSAVAEVLSQNYPVPIKFVGIKDRFGESGKPEELLEKFGCTSKDIVKAVKEVIEMKK
ncbi:MAG: transketolase family protein [archaeon]